MIQLNYRDSKPIYEQIKEGLRHLLVTRSIEPDEKLPSVRELAATLAINPNTIQRAYRELESEGYIYSVPGKGSYASSQEEILGTRQEELFAEFDRTVEELRLTCVTTQTLSERLARTGEEQKKRGAETMIEVAGLEKSFDGFAALSGMDLSVPRGAIYGLVGPNGAGKTTLIRHLTGVYRQDAGEIWIDGEAVYENPGIKGRIGYIPDDFYYFANASTLTMKKYYQGIYPGFDPALFEKLAPAFTSIDPKQPIRRLSKGMQKQAAFWLTISARPDVLILDEPVDGLDPVMRRQIWSILMSDVAEYGVTVLVSSHNLRELEDVCDHVGIMNRGKLLLERSLDELQGSVCKLQAAFREEIDSFPPELAAAHWEKVGRVYTLICRSTKEEAKERVEAMQPIFVDVLPLTLEEIFIYELGGEDYAVKEILF